MTHYADRLPGPLGHVWAVVNERSRLVQLDFAGGRNAPRSKRQLETRYAERGEELHWSSTRLKPLARSLERYFRGRLQRFDLKVAPRGTTR